MNKRPNPNRAKRGKVGSAPKGHLTKSFPIDLGHNDHAPIGAQIVDPDMKHHVFLDAVKYCCKLNSGVFVTCHKIKGKNAVMFEEMLLRLPSGFSDPNQREDFFRFMESAARVFEQMNGRGWKPVG